jgi:hypothetical protein
MTSDAPRPDDHDHASELSEVQLRVRALESVLTEKGYVDPAALDLLIERHHQAWERAAHRTPHGSPIHLKPDDFAV